MRWKRLLLIVFLILSILPFTFVGCGIGENSDSSGAGRVGFSLTLQDTINSRVLSRQTSSYNGARFECQTTEYTIDTIEAQVKDENGEIIATGGPFDCEAGEGTVDEIVPGTNYTVCIFAKDSEGIITFEGESDPFTVVAGEIVYAGLILLTPIEARLVGEFKGTGFGSDPWSALFDADFDGSGSENYQVIASSDDVLESGTYTYELDVDGSMAVTLATGIEFTGILNADNNVFAIADTDFSMDEFIEMDVAIKKSTGLTSAILNGEYIGVRIGSFGSTALISATFNGEGNGTFLYLANSAEQILNGEFTYGVGSDGSATISNLVAVASSGIVNEDGRILSIVDTDLSYDEEISMIVFIRTEAALSNATINGDYVGVRFGYSYDQVAIPDSSVMSINADGNGNMVFEILSSSSGNLDTFDATYDVDLTNGRICIELSNGEILEGAINVDGEIFNFVNTTDINDSFIEIGVAIRKTQ